MAPDADAALPAERARAAPAQRSSVLRGWDPSDRLLAILFLLPTLALVAALYVFPLAWSFALSFTRFSAIKSPPPRWVGLDNYLAVLGSARVWEALTTTATYALLAVGTELLLGLGLAMLLNRRFPGAGLLTTILLLPMMMAPAIAAAFWTRMMFHPQGGVLNSFFLGLGLQPPDWFSDPHLALLTLVVVDVWQWTPFMLLLSLAALRAVPRDLYEAAEVDQASAWFKLRHVTLPTIWPLVMVALIFRTMDAVRIFEHQWVASGYARNTATIATVLYGIAFRDWDTGLSSALACIVLAITLALTHVYVRFLTRATGR